MAARARKITPYDGRLALTGAAHEARKLVRDQIVAEVMNGASMSSAGAEFGVSRSFARREMLARGLDPAEFNPRDAGTLRREIQDMKPLDAVEYVLEAYEQLTGAFAEAEKAVKAFGCTPAQGRIFAMLHRHLGRIVPHEAVMAMLDAGRSSDKPTSQGSFTVLVCLLRKKIAPEYTIRTEWGHGYALERVE